MGRPLITIATHMERRRNRLIAVCWFGFGLIVLGALTLAAYWLLDAHLMQQEIARVAETGVQI